MHSSNVETQYNKIKGNLVSPINISKGMVASSIPVAAVIILSSNIDIKGTSARLIKFGFRVNANER